MKHMPTVELFGSAHLFTADDASTVTLGKLFFSGIGKELIHGSDNTAVAHKVCAALLELCEGEVEVANNVERKRIEELDIGEERNVDRQLAQVRK